MKRFKQKKTLERGGKPAFCHHLHSSLTSLKHSSWLQIPVSLTPNAFLSCSLLPSLLPSLPPSLSASLLFPSPVLLRLKACCFDRLIRIGHPLQLLLRHDGYLGIRLHLAVHHVARVLGTLQQLDPGSYREGGREGGMEGGKEGGVSPLTKQIEEKDALPRFCPPYLSLST